MNWYFLFSNKVLCRCEKCFSDFRENCQKYERKLMENDSSSSAHCDRISVTEFLTYSTPFFYLHEHLNTKMMCWAIFLAELTYRPRPRREAGPLMGVTITSATIPSRAVSAIPTRTDSKIPLRTGSRPHPTVSVSHSARALAERRPCFSKSHKHTFPR